MSCIRVGRRHGSITRGCIFIVLALLVMVSLVGCQKLFHEEGAPLKGQTVNLAVTVPETPPPASKPLTAEPLPATPTGGQPSQPLNPKLLPQQEPAIQTSPLIAVPAAHSPVVRPLSDLIRANTVMAGRTINEDTVLRGVVLVQGSLVVAPQATLRLEPGTSLHFQRPAGSVQNPRLVVQGRLVCSGTPQKPVVISSAFRETQVADWGGLLLLSTEKKNSLDYCRIDGAETGIEAHHSQFTSRGMEIIRSREGLALYDSVAMLQAAIVSRCDVGLAASDSELELREVTLRENRLGGAVIRSSLVASACQLRGNGQEGLLVEHSRFRINGCVAVDNRVGMLVQEGDGLVQQCRFALNREAGLGVVGARVKIVSSSFQDNLGVGLRLEGVRGSVVQSSFSLNRGGNLLNSGSGGFAAVLNWWGTTDEAKVAEGIRYDSRPSSVRQVTFVPFLTARPALAP